MIKKRRHRPKKNCRDNTYTEALGQDPFKWSEMQKTYTTEAERNH